MVMAAGSQVQLVNHYDYDALGYIKLLFLSMRFNFLYLRWHRFLRRTEHTCECVSCQDGLWGFLKGNHSTARRFLNHGMPLWRMGNWVMRSSLEGYVTAWSWVVAKLFKTLTIFRKMSLTS